MRFGKSVVLLSGLIILGAAAATGIVQAKKATEAPEKITISACAEGKEKPKSPVTFNHKEHGERAKGKCDACHHEQKGLTAASTDEVKKCTGCHMGAESEGVKKGMDCTVADNKKNPFHKRCLGCHKEEANKEKAPTKCNDCHKGAAAGAAAK